MIIPSGQDCGDVSIEIVEREVKSRHTADKVRHKEDKENMSIDTDGWCDIGEAVEIERAQNVGLGLRDNSKKALRKVRSVNVVHIADAPVKKENKLRRESSVTSQDVLALTPYSQQYRPSDQSALQYLWWLPQ
jgi:hypothetical protein